MRIGIDVRPIGRQQTGNERVMRSLSSALVEKFDHEFVLYFSDRSAAANWATGAPQQASIRVIPVGNPFIRLPLALPYLAHRDRIDALLCHMNCPPLARPGVATIVHDVSFARHPEYFSVYERFLLNRSIPASMRWSDAVIFGSEFTRDEVADVYGIGGDKCSVAPYAGDPIFHEPIIESPDRRRPYFLAVGNLQPRKNLATLVRGFRALIESDPAIAEDLLIVGQSQYQEGSVFDEAADLLDAGRVTFTGYVSDTELLGYVRGATAMVYPSVYEGFGLPPLEAMAVGTPAIVSDIPVMREVAGDAAIRVSPMSIEGWAESLKRVATQPVLRRELSEKGHQRARSFTWDRAAVVTMAALEYASDARRGRPSLVRG